MAREYPVLDSIRGVRLYKPGDIIELDDEQAEILLRDGVVGEAIEPEGDVNPGAAEAEQANPEAAKPAAPGKKPG
jgi:hypothetical protein